MWTVFVPGSCFHRCDLHLHFDAIQKEMGSMKESSNLGIPMVDFKRHDIWVWWSFGDVALLFAVDSFSGAHDDIWRLDG